MVIKKIMRYVLLVILLLFNPISNAGEFKVVLKPPTKFDNVRGSTSWYIFISGDIDKNSPEKFRKSVEGLTKYGADVYLDSPGGNLISGIELGRMIRKFGFNTHINKQNLDVSKFDKSECMSACAMTFLGGSFRDVSEGSLYGVHRFDNEYKPSKNDLDTGQILTTLISNYIIEMGVNP